MEDLPEHLKTADRAAGAKLLTKSSLQMGGVNEERFDRTDEACAAAVAASQTGRYNYVAVWSELFGIIEYTDVALLARFWGQPSE